MRGHLIDTVRLAIEFIRFGGGCRGYSSSISFEQKILKLEEDNQLAEEEIAKIRREFDAAKQSFFKIPDALKGMHKMDPNGIYVNKNLRLENIQVYGFDYDYTLAHYSANLRSLIYELAKEHLVNEVWYPDSCLEFKYDPTFPIRGLYYDKLKGCLLKLDFFGSIEPDGCYFGRRKHGFRCIYAYRLPGILISRAYLVANIVQHFVDAKLEFDAPYVYQDVNHAIQHVHGSGLAHRGILSDPQRYPVKDVRDDELYSNICIICFYCSRMLKENGKKLFLLTNSLYYFVDGGMRFMLEDSLGERDSWRELFDVVIAKANKPEFYTSKNLFCCYDEDKDTLAFSKVDSFLPDRVYYHGCLKFFLQITKRNGPEVIYFGDHLYSDLQGPSKAGWRTAAIIHELENEIQIQNEDSYHFEHRSQESAFAYNIHQYADVYTSKAKNFLFYPPEARFHVPFDIKIMPHHLNVYEELNYWLRRAKDMKKERRKTYLQVMRHYLYIKRYMKPCLVRIKQKILCLTGIHISIWMDVISKSRFLTCVSEESGSERSIKHVFHCTSCLLPLLI
ncbi:unnamed protein product [Camellia sinensis]